MLINEHIGRGHTIVCANVRLAHRFKHLYAQEQLRRGRKAWETPDILPWQAWLRRCWNPLREREDAGGLLLNGEQETALWQQIIEQSDYRNSLLQVTSVANQAAAAWQRMKQYQVKDFPPGTHMNVDARAFKSWADKFRLHCDKHHWINNASLADALRGKVASNTDIFGKGLALAGFDRFTPQQTLLFGALKDAGISVHDYREPGRKDFIEVRDFADIKEEIRAAACWARERVEDDNRITVGIITPDLRILRTRIRYIFEDVLAPGNLRYRDAATPLPFSISVGQPLVEYPLISAIFPILGLNKAPISLDTLGILLRTPFIKGHDEERAGRALLDEKLRSRKQLAFNWDDLLYFAGRAGEKGQPIPILTNMLQEIRSVLVELPAKQSPDAWADSFNRFLEIFGWPGERNLDSTEYQQVQSWHSALDRFVSLRLVNPALSRADALSHLRRIANGISFQPETAETPIQVLDPQGAAALAFDCVWMLGLTDEAWPPRSRPNPFIPVSLQKKYGMPGADADAALEQAGALQEALVRSTPHIVLSHARNETETDRTLLASPLLPNPKPSFEAETQKQRSRIHKPAHDDTAEKGEEVKNYAQEIFGSSIIEPITDTTAPPVTGPHPGGVSLFRDQSQCPFRAFARHRLHSRQPEQADIGLDAMERGTLLHQLMKNTWSRLQNRETLAALTGQEREDLIRDLVTVSIADYRKRNPLVFSKRFAAIEGKRLARVLGEWLELELQRPPFEVLSVEKDTHLEIAGMKFKTRLDRVDVLEDGSHVIIDYKSGQAGVNAWAGARPDDPQMPLYAVNHPEPVAGVAFARLKRGRNFGFEGLAESADILPGIKAFYEDSRAKKFIPDWAARSGAMPPSWKEVFNNWRIVLQGLAHEFRKGVSTVTPQRGACDYCEQQPLCRIHDINAQRQGQDRDD